MCVSQKAHLTSLTLCVTAQVRKTRDMTWNPVRTTEEGTIPENHAKEKHSYVKDARILVVECT